MTAPRVPPGLAVNLFDDAVEATRAQTWPETTGLPLGTVRVPLVWMAASVGSDPGTVLTWVLESSSRLPPVRTALDGLYGANRYSP